MANLRAVAYDNETTINLKATDTGTDNDPFVPIQAIENGATSSNQTTANNSLASIDSKTPALFSGSIPVILPASQITTLTPPTTVAVTGTFWQASQPVSFGALPAGANVIGAISNTTFSVSNFPSTQTVAGTVTANTGLAQPLTLAQLPSSFQISNFPSSQVVTFGALPAGTNAIGSITNTAFASTQSGTWTVGLTGTLPAFASIPTFNIGTIGSIATAANQSTTNTLIGDVVEIAPSTDTGSSGLNGRLQRITQRITNLISLFPSSLGAKTAATSLAVTLSTDGVASGIANQIGEVQTSPTANTVLARLKSIVDALVFGAKTKANSISVTPATDAIYPVTIQSGYVIPSHNYQAYTYTGSNITTIVYKTGGANGTTVATETITYSGSNPTSRSIV